MEIARSGPHVLVDWLRRQGAGPEANQTETINPPTECVVGCKVSFKVQAKDEFGLNLNKGGEKVSLVVQLAHRETMSRESKAADFNCELEVETLKNIYGRLTQPSTCYDPVHHVIYLCRILMGML